MFDSGATGKTTWSESAPIICHCWPISRSDGPSDCERSLKRGSVPHRAELIAQQSAESTRFEQLLVKHGFDPKRVNMDSVFSTWDPEIMEYFVDRGANLESGMPLA